MNRTKIPWCDRSWNPCTGCKHGCWYCYAKKLCLRFKKIFPNGFEPTFYPDRLLEPWKSKKSFKIFVCSISDLFAPWILKDWRDRILESAWCCPVKHTFQFLTKQPERIPNIPYPKNFWMGTTVTMEHEDWKNIESIRKVQAGVKFVSFEPLLGRLPSHVSLKGIDWIIIGKLTGSRKVKLNPDWVWEILAAAKKLEIPFFMKDNLSPEFPPLFRVERFPEIA